MRLQPEAAWQADRMRVLQHHSGFRQLQMPKVRRSICVLDLLRLNSISQVVEMEEPNRVCCLLLGGYREHWPIGCPAQPSNNARLCSHISPMRTAHSQPNMRPSLKSLHSLTPSLITPISNLLRGLCVSVAHTHNYTFTH